MLFRSVSGWQDGALTGAAIGSFLFFATVASYLFSQKPLNLAILDGVTWRFYLFCTARLLAVGKRKPNV